MNLNHPHRTERFIAFAILSTILGIFLGIAFGDPGVPLWMLPVFSVFGLHLELLTAQATAPGSAGAAGAAASGDSLTVKNAPTPAWAKILGIWADFQTAGFAQVVAPSFHDTTRGFRMRVGAGLVSNQLPDGVAIGVYPQETLSILLAGSATAGDVETLCMLMGYETLPGTSQRLIDWKQFQKHATKLTTVDVSLSGAAAGYTGEEAINADSDLLLANRDYAVLGGIVDTECAAVYIKGPDTGNVRIGFPADTLAPESSKEFFLRMARAYNAKMIPVINSGNKASTIVGFVQDENNVSPKVTLFLALLN